MAEKVGRVRRGLMMRGRASSDSGRTTCGRKNAGRELSYRPGGRGDDPLRTVNDSKVGLGWGCAYNSELWRATATQTRYATCALVLALC